MKSKLFRRGPCALIPYASMAIFLSPGLSMGATRVEGSGIYHRINQEESEIRGKVVNRDNSPLQGVSISVKGVPGRSTQTNEKGEFMLKVPAQATLTFSSVGYAKQEIKLATNQKTIQLTLESNESVMDEVVVVGYGTQRKSDLTGSVSSINANQINAFPLAGTAQALQGRAAGVSVTSTNGEPGKAPRVRIRGGSSINASSDPLYVVDGFPGSSAPLPKMSNLSKC
ncbi:carboxypeptidase-like regulatory domain-containing protein [Sphingobacterium sp. E70]|uniref:carboxypeptidase-like regulatory domain-containing protein n=1 Tax=Sphingobacterium sp. E70 TaxID=2853439 RepID=UPI00211BBE32|nr:carboxypeptidase-like regulatory domain-containing protein [Sphingobacterium sp. E70]